MKQLQIIEHNGERVITTAQLAEAYETDADNVKRNFGRNKGRFQEGLHFYLLKGDELRAFKSLVTNSPLVDKFTPQLYLWTKRGASRHCKILDTDKAWEQFDYLESSYFDKKPEAIPAYTLNPATLEGVANIGRLIERTMKNQGSMPYEVATVLKSVFEQSGISLPECFVKVPECVQMQLNLTELLA